MRYSIQKHLSLFTLVIITALTSCKKDIDYKGDYSLSNPGGYVNYMDNQGAQVANNYKIYSVPTGMPVAGATYIDMGSFHIADLVWKVSDRTKKLVNSAGGVPSNNETFCQMVYDNTKLYIAFQCKDADLIAQDTLQIMIDHDNDGDNLLIVKIAPPNNIVQLNYTGGALSPSSTLAITPVASTNAQGVWMGKIAIQFQPATNLPMPSFMSTWKVNFKRINYNNSTTPTFVDYTYWKYPSGNEYFSSGYPDATITSIVRAPVTMKGLILNTVPMDITALGFDVIEVSPDGLDTKTYTIELDGTHNQPGIFEETRPYALATKLTFTPFIIEANGQKRTATSQTIDPVR